MEDASAYVCMSAISNYISISIGIGSRSARAWASALAQVECLQAYRSRSALLFPVAKLCMRASLLDRFRDGHLAGGSVTWFGTIALLIGQVGRGLAAAS